MSDTAAWLLVAVVLGWPLAVVFVPGLEGALVETYFRLALRKSKSDGDLLATVVYWTITPHSDRGYLCADSRQALVDCLNALTDRHKEDTHGG